MKNSRSPVSFHCNNFIDSQRVNEFNLTTEQARNINTDSAMVINHFGSGAILKSLQDNIIFDSSNLTSEQAALAAVKKLDGTGLTVHNQPSDSTLGNQLSIDLNNSSVLGRFSVKICIIGLDFNGNIQSDYIYFNRNGKKITSKHYTKIICIFLNDFDGNQNCSRNWGGILTIKEAESFEMSLDPIMASQDLYPNLFWRDFKIADNSLSLEQVIQDGLGEEYSVDLLDINTTGLQFKELIQNDVTSHVGQKFLAKTDNIQKITILLGIEKDNLETEDDWYDWTGDLVVSVYSLQSSITCSSDIIPNLAIDFDPNPQPIAQISFNQESLKDYGTVLTDILQPIDFVFSNSKIGKASGVKPGDYYSFTIKRIGNSEKGKFLIGCGKNISEENRITLFNSSWVDIPEESLWFRIWTNAVKISDGIGYEQGKGIEIEKTIQDSNTGSIIDNEMKFFSFLSSGEGVLNIGLIKAVEKYFGIQQNERSGNDFFSYKKFIPSFQFVNENDLLEIEDNIDPFLIGCVEDNNPKSNITYIEGYQIYPGLVKNDTFCIVNPGTDLLSFNLIGSKLIPNFDCKKKDYKIYKSTFCKNVYGDLNGDGQIDSSDLIDLTSLIGESLNLESTQQKILNGEIDTLQLLRADLDGDGYITSADADLMNDFLNKQINSFPVGSYFNHICLQVQPNIGRYDGYFDCAGLIRLDGYYGQNLIDPSELSEFELEYDGYYLTPQMHLDEIFSNIPFVPVQFKIQAQPFWQEYLVNINSEVKLVPAIFSNSQSLEKKSCSQTSELCQDLNLKDMNFQAGRNDIFFPGNIYVGGEILRREDNSLYPGDIEIGTIILQLPPKPISELSLNIFEKFIMESDSGKNAFGTEAMKYADCSFVKQEDLILNKLKFNVSIQSYYPNLDGYSEDGGGIIIDPIFAVYIDHITGILTLSIKDLDYDPLYSSLVTKIQIIVYLKKSGWKNQVLTINTNQLSNLLNL